MIKNKDVTLVFDFNNLAMRSIFTCAFSGSRDSVAINDFSTEEEQGVLIRKLAIDMTYIIRLVNSNRVIVCCDDRHPWRKSLLESEVVGYKENRHKDENKDWDAIFAALNRYKDVLRKKNVVVYEMGNSEADDLAAFVKQDIFTDNHSSIIYVSSDKDWLQLVDFDVNHNNFCAVLNPIANSHKKKVFNVNHEFIEWINSTNSTNSLDDLFFTNVDMVKEQMKTLVQNANVEVNEIVPNEVLLSKLLCGDVSDNVPSFYEFYDKKGKLARITDSKMKKIVNYFGLSDGKDLVVVAKKPEFKQYIETLLKHEIDDVDMSERADRQRHLVELNISLFPSKLVETYNYMSSNVSETGKIEMPVSQIKMETILAGTSFYDENFKKIKNNDIFNDMKDLEKYIVPVKETKTLF